MILIADSSALIALAVCDVLQKLDLIYSEVRVPEAVYREVTQIGKPQSEKLAIYLKDKVVSIDSKQSLLMLYTIDVGEQEAMLLFKQLGAQWLLTDDSKARKVAELNHIRVIGSLGILLKMKDDGLLESLHPLLVLLNRSGLYYSEGLMQTVLKAAGESQ